jgi:ABC-type multidrug transport system ATPase subunit
MKISCINAGKRFNRDWIFRHFNYEFTDAGCYAITGPNGSGKSTLLQVIAGSIITSEGKIEFQLNKEGKPLQEESIYKLISIAAPYVDVIEEMTLKEFFKFHQTFKPFLPGISIEHIIGLTDLEKAANKQIRYYSSGMKQRVKLAQAIFSNTPFLFLDEPCTNFDETGYSLYHQLIEEYGKNRLIIISSNDPKEYSFCSSILRVIDYK